MNDAIGAAIVAGALALSALCGLCAPGVAVVCIDVHAGGLQRLASWEVMSDGSLRR